MQTQGFRLRWRGQAGFQPIVEYSTDFVTWFPLPGEFQNQGDDYEITDAGSSVRVFRFYRIREQPIGR